jgi:hypothetical protein
MRLALSVASLFLISTFYVGSQGNILHLERSFFGVTKITKDPSGEFIQMLHGRTLHGMQWIPPILRGEPLAYYHRSGPLGQLFEALNKPGRFKRVAVLGLGSGAISCYANMGQHWTYYEIDPVVERLARDSRFFTYLQNSEGEIGVELGDGRLLLAEAADGAYDLVIMDAYNSDALPVHLLTREALELYLQKLSPHGILAFHISNRYLDLEPVLANLAHDAGLYCVIQHDEVVSMPGSAMGAKISSKYALLVRRRDDLGPLCSDKRWVPAQRLDAIGVWTDSYSSILAILKWWPRD